MLLRTVVRTYSELALSRARESQVLVLVLVVLLVRLVLKYSTGTNAHVLMVQYALLITTTLPRMVYPSAV